MSSSGKRQSKSILTLIHFLVDKVLIISCCSTILRYPNGAVDTTRLGKL